MRRMLSVPYNQPETMRLLQVGNTQFGIRRLEKNRHDDYRIDIQIINLSHRIINSVMSCESDFASIDTQKTIALYPAFSTTKGQSLDDLQGSSLFQAFSRWSRLTFDARRLGLF